MRPSGLFRPLVPGAVTPPHLSSRLAERGARLGLSPSWTPLELLVTSGESEDFVHRRVNTLPPVEIGRRFRFPAWMDRIGQQYDVEAVDWIEPHRRAREAGVTEASVAQVDSP